MSSTARKVEPHCMLATYVVHVSVPMHHGMGEEMREHSNRCSYLMRRLSLPKRGGGSSTLCRAFGPSLVNTAISMSLDT